MDERERLAAAEADIRAIHQRLNRQFGEIHEGVGELRGEIEQSRDECANGLKGLSTEVRAGFDRQRDSARAWTLGAVGMVTGVLSIAVAVAAAVLK